MTVKTLSELKELPSDTHFVIITQESHTYDDGYGHPNSPSYSTRVYLSYTAVSNTEELQAKIKELDEPKYGERKLYKVFRMTPVAVVKHVTFEFGEER